jgi:lytic murein transglycosylase
MKRRLSCRHTISATMLLVAAMNSACSQPTGDWAQCIDGLRAELPQHPEVKRETFDAQTRAAQDMRPAVETATRSQPEFVKKIWDYVALLADAQRAEDGKDILQREAATLPSIALRYGVDPATMVSVFGVETDYGRVEGRYPVIDATLSRACANRDSKERRGQFFAALQLVQDGDVDPSDFRGSWAGAFGLTQFMPATFLRYRARGDGDGSIDIYHSVPDALATTSNFLNGLGWSDKLPWGVEVTVPAGVAAQWNALEKDHGCLLTGESGGKCRSIAQWAAAGLKRANGSALVGGDRKRLEAETKASLLMPAGVDGPAWLVTRNYEAVWRYNRADAYALSIGLLSDALRNEPPMQKAWPTDDAGLSRAEFRELQSMLLLRGHLDVVPDGHDGPRTQDAVKAEERSRSLAESGRAGQKMLKLLRGDTAADAPASAASR